MRESYTATMKLSFSILGCTLVLLSLFPPVAGAQTTGEDEQERIATAGQRALAAGDYASARTNFEQLAKLDPEVAEVHATLAIIYLKQRDYEMAVRECRTALRLKPGLPKIDSLLGISLAESGQFAEALPRLVKGFKQTEFPEIKRMCGLQLLRAYTGLGRDADAVESALALNKLYPDDPEILYHTGRIYGNYAYVVMEKLHDKAPGSIWMLQAQGEANESQKNYDAAIFALNQILALEPRRPGVHYRLGRIYLARYKERATQNQEDRDAAIREFAAELAVDPGNGNAGYELAVMNVDLGNLEEARRQFEQVLERFPSFEEALVGLGGVYLTTQKPELAVKPLDQATRIKPDDEVAWYRLSQAARATGDKQAQQKALAAFLKLHNSSPATPQQKPNSGDEITPQQIGAAVNP